MKHKKYKYAYFSIPEDNQFNPEKAYEFGNKGFKLIATRPVVLTSRERGRKAGTEFIFMKEYTTNVP